MKRAALVIWLGLLALALVLIARAPPLENDLTQFLPKAATADQQLLLEQLRQGPAGRLILLQLSAASPDRLAAASHALARSLQDSAHFERVINGGGALARLENERLFDYRYLLSPNSPQAFSAEALEQALSARLQELSSPLGMPDKQHLAADPLAAYRRLLQSWRHGLQAPNAYAGAWLSQAGDSALLMLQSAYPAFDLDRQQHALARIQDAFAALPDSAGMQLRMSGAPAFAVESRDRIRRQTQLLSLGASLGVSLLLLLAFRSAPLLALAAAPLASGILAGTASVIVFFDTLHGLTLAFGITLIGVAVDYPIHIFSHTGGGTSAFAAVKRIWPIMRLSLISTLLGFSALLFSDFGGLSQLGVFAVTGLLAAAAFSRFVLPLWTPRLNRGNRLTPLALSLFTQLRLPWLPLLLCLPSALFIALRGEVLWEQDLARLNPLSAEAKAMDAQLREELGAPDVKRMLLIRHPDAEQVLQWSEALAAPLRQLQEQGKLAAFELPSRYLPSARTQGARRDALPRADSLAARIKQAQAGMPFKAQLFDPFVRAVERSQGMPPLTPEEAQNTPLGARLQSLLTRRGDIWIGRIMLSGIDDEQAIRDIAGRYPANVSYLDLARESAQLVAAYRDEALRIALMAFAIILLTLLFSLRSVRLTLRTLTPVAAAVLGATALLCWLGQALSVFHLAALLLVIGIGIDYALFVARTPLDSPRFAATAGSLLLCSLSTLLVFGLLALSNIPVLFALGVTVFCGTLLSLLFSAMMVRAEA